MKIVNRSTKAVAEADTALAEELIRSGAWEPADKPAPAKPKAKPKKDETPDE